ncbi:MAG: hypothetical protein IPJ06_16930 [Saprospiraceae bacterium]|nr:hypothetical protein [Saprospiraceae bacterium]
MKFGVWNLVVSPIGVFYPCQYQDYQDLRIYRMNLFWSFAFGHCDLFEIWCLEFGGFTHWCFLSLSVSGLSGFEDLQDEFVLVIRIWSL